MFVMFVNLILLYNIMVGWYFYKIFINCVLFDCGNISE